MELYFISKQQEIEYCYGKCQANRTELTDGIIGWRGQGKPGWGEGRGGTLTSIRRLLRDFRVLNALSSFSWIWLLYLYDTESAQVI